MNLLILIILSFSTLGFTKVLTPLELADLSQERAPLVKMALEGQAAASSQVSQSKLLANPVFSLQAGSLKAATQAGSVMDLTIGQPIPWPGKRKAEINSAKILERISSVDAEESKLLVHHSVSLLALELAIMTELEKHHTDRKHRFSIIQRYLNSRPLPSPKQKIDKDLIETQINLVETQMYDIETKKKSLQEQLKFISGVEELQIKVPWSMRAPLAKESYLSQLENNPQYIKALKYEELANNQIKQAKYAAKPDIVIGANYRRENVAPINHFLHANVSVVIPIIDRGQHSIEVASANARKEEAGKKLVYYASVADLNRSYQELTSAFRSSQIFKIEKIKDEGKRFKVAEDAFMKGRIDVLTFLETDTQIHDAINLSYLSYMKYFTALSALNLRIGQKLEIR